MNVFVWWFFFTLAGVWLQHLIPGTDLLAPGLLICLQHRRTRQAVWLTGIWIILQEGTGTLAFGSGIFWYGGLAVFFHMGKWLFDSGNIFFVMIMGAGMGLLHLLLVSAMSDLQDIEIIMQRLVVDSVLQAFFFTLIWAICHGLYLQVVPHDESI